MQIHFKSASREKEKHRPTKVSPRRTHRKRDLVRSPKSNRRQRQANAENYHRFVIEFGILIKLKISGEKNVNLYLTKRKLLPYKGKQNFTLKIQQIDINTGQSSHFLSSAIIDRDIAFVGLNVSRRKNQIFRSIGFSYLDLFCLHFIHWRFRWTKHAPNMQTTGDCCEMNLWIMQPRGKKPPLFPLPPQSHAWVPKWTTKRIRGASGAIIYSRGRKTEATLRLISISRSLVPNCSIL